MVGHDSVIVHNIECGKIAQRLLKNKEFRRWFHREYKGKSGFGDGKDAKNPDMGPEDILDAWDEWISSGSPVL